MLLISTVCPERRVMMSSGLLEKYLLLFLDWVEKNILLLTLFQRIFVGLAGELWIIPSWTISSWSRSGEHFWWNWSAVQKASFRQHFALPFVFPTLLRLMTWRKWWAIIWEISKQNKLRFRRHCVLRAAQQHVQLLRESWNWFIWIFIYIIIIIIIK